MSDPAMIALRRLVAEAIATGRTSWSRDDFARIATRNVEHELYAHGLTRGLMYAHTALTAEAIEVAFGWREPATALNQEQGPT